MAQVGSAIMLGCCDNSGSINGRIQLEFLSVNINGFIIILLLLELSLRESTLFFTAAIPRLPES